MHGWRRARWVLAAGALALGCTLPFLSGPRWVRVTSAHFEVLSSAGAAQARELAVMLERFRVLALPLRSGSASMTPVVVYAFGDPEDYARVAPAGEPAFALGVGSRPAIAFDTRADAAREALLHEYVHLLLQASRRATPAWYEEGLAQLFGAAEIEGSQATVGRLPESIRLRLVYGTPLGVRRMLTSVDRRRWTDDATRMFSVESWTLAHFIYTGYRAGYPKRAAALADYLARLAAGEPAHTAFEPAFGMSLEAFEGELLRYMAGEGFAYVVLAVDPPAADLEVTSEPLPRDAWLFRLGELAFASDRRGVAREWLDQALAVSPNHARALAALGREQALAFAPDDAEVQRLLGDALLRVSQPTEAGEAYGRSLALDPDAAAARAGLGRVLAQGSLPPEPAIDALERAAARVPLADADLALLARLYLRAGQPERARAVARAIVQQPHGRRFASPQSDADLDALIAESGLETQPRGLDASMALRMDVESPEDGLRISGILGIAEVRGRAGLGEVLDHDVVIALDESGSTFAPIRVPPSRSAPSDVAGDSAVKLRVIDAELAAARRVLEQFDPGHTRAALLTFAAVTRMQAGLGALADTRAAVDAYVVRPDDGGTSLASPLVEALRVFFVGRLAGERRTRSVLLLSDGQATVPNERVGQRDAVRVARQLGEAGVRVFAFAIGREAIENARTFREIAELSGGAFVPVENPADVEDVLASINLSGVDDVEVRNLTTGKEARALRVFGDGSFDAFVSLVPGENTLELTVRVPETRPLVLLRRVHFAPPAKPSAQDLQQAEAVRERLRVRTIETELTPRIRRSAPRPARDPSEAEERARELEIEAEPSPEPR